MEDSRRSDRRLSVFGAITAIIFGPAYLKSRERREMQATVRAAIDKGQPLPPEVIEALSKEATTQHPVAHPRHPPRHHLAGRRHRHRRLQPDQRHALASATTTGDGPNFGGGLLGIAAIPVTIGLAFIVLSFFNKNKD